MMPELNGFQLLMKIREKSNIPVIMLTARVASSDKVLSLDMGADDYVTKPFDPLELCARVKANIRRYQSAFTEAVPTIIKAGCLELDADKCQLLKNGEQVIITSTEFKVLQLFMTNPNRVFTKAQISAAGWGEKGFITELQQTSATIWCAVLKEEVQGFLALRAAGGQSEILNVAVAPLYVRRGIGLSLLMHALDALRVQGVQQVSLEAAAENQPANNLYAKAGFAIWGRRKDFYGKGKDALIWGKEL